MKSTMTVTVDIKEGEQAFFKIEFMKSDFMAVIDSIDNLTFETVQNNPLWVVL